MVVVPFIGGVVVVERHAHIGAVVGGAAVPPIYLPDGVDGAVAAAGDALALTLVEAGKQQIQERQIVTQRQTAPQAVERTDAAAEAAVGRAVAGLGLVVQRGLIRDDISKHTLALLDELGAAAGAGDLDAAPAPGNAQLLAALGAAVIVV